MTDILDAFVTDVVNVFPGVDGVDVIETGGVGPAGPAGTGSGLPSGGTVDAVVVNTAPGIGTWAPPDDLSVTFLTNPTALSDALQGLADLQAATLSSAQLYTRDHSAMLRRVTQTANYTSTADVDQSELVPFDTTSGALTYDLPVTSGGTSDGIRAGVIIVAGTNKVTVRRTGSDVFSGGATTFDVNATLRAVEFIYDANHSTWTVLSVPEELGAGALLDTTDSGSVPVKSTVGPTDGFLTSDGQQATEAVIAAKLADGTSILNTSGVLSVKDSGITSAKIADGAIVNADVNASAAIAYSKLNLASSITSADIVDGTIVNGDVSSTAGIVLDKLAAGTLAAGANSSLIVTEISTLPLLQFKRATDGSARGTYGDSGILWTDGAASPTTLGSFGVSSTGVLTAGTAKIIAGDATADTHLVNRQTGDARWAQLSGYTMAGNITLASGNNIILSTTTGTKIGTGTTQLLGFFNATPVAQQGSTADLRTGLINLGLFASGGASPLNLNGGALTAVSGTFSGGSGGTTVTLSGTTAPKLTGIENGTTLGSLVFTNTISLPTWNFHDEVNNRDIVQVIGGASGGALSIIDGASLNLGTTSGTKIGAATSQKLAFWNATPIVQPASTTDLRTVLINTGLLASGGASPLNLNGGAFTTSGLVTISANNIATDTTTGMQIATGSTQKLGFFGATPVVRQAAYTQTFSTATRTQTANTAATLTDNTTGSADTTLQALSATYTPAELRNNFADLAAMVNKNTADTLVLAKLIVSLIDDQQAYGFVT